MKTLKTTDFCLRYAITGCLLGTAVGDSLGLPAEGLSRLRQRRLFGEIGTHRFLLGRGMYSDDTEHAILVAQSLISGEGLERGLARRLRNWLLCLPAGVGLATLRACLKLTIGVPSHRSGVYSAGNGPAMRAPLLGVCFGDDLPKMRSFVRSSTRITHTDPKAEFGGAVVAIAAGLSARGLLTAESLWEGVERALPEADELRQQICLIGEKLQEGLSVSAFADALGLESGVSGYMYHTVPVALYAALRHTDDFRSAVTEVIACGGDTDTTAAIVGGIIGAGVGKSGIPREWLAGIVEPFGPECLERLADQLAEVMAGGSARRPVVLSPFLIVPRNALFAGVVLYHGLRRLLPPY